MNRRWMLVLTAPLIAVLFSCSGPKEEVKPPVIEQKETPAPPPPAPPVEYRYSERYFVHGAAIDDSKNIDDPLQAVRVIQLKEGGNDVLVISSFDKEQVGGKEVATENWLGLEGSSLKPGTYKLADIPNIRFYRFFLSEQGKRFDGQKYEGTLTIDAVKGGYVTGHLNAVIQGVTKSFHEASTPFTLTYSGTFRIPEVPLEATVMGKRK